MNGVFGICRLGNECSSLECGKRHPPHLIPFCDLVVVQSPLFLSPMNPLAAPKSKTPKLPEIPQVPPEVHDALEAAADKVRESDLTQEEQEQIIQNLAKASDHLEGHKLALEDATAAQKKLNIYLYYFFRFFDLISSHVREFKNYILDPKVPMHHKMLYASLYCFLVYLLVFLVVLKMHGLIGVACSPLVGDTEKCRVLQQARRHEQAAARSDTTVAADMTFNCNDVVYDERGTRVVHGRLKAACVDGSSIIGAISLTRTTATPFSMATLAWCAVVEPAPAIGETKCSSKRTPSVRGAAMAVLAAAARRVGAPVACLGQSPCAIAHRMASAFVLRGVHIACLSWATKAGRTLRGTLRGGLATEICPRHTRPVGTLIAPVDALPRFSGAGGVCGAAP